MNIKGFFKNFAINAKEYTKVNVYDYDSGEYIFNGPISEIPDYIEVMNIESWTVNPETGIHVSVFAGGEEF